MIKCYIRGIGELANVRSFIYEAPCHTQRSTDGYYLRFMVSKSLGLCGVYMGWFIKNEVLSAHITLVGSASKD
jgi:hypothetical protein